MEGPTLDTRLCMIPRGYAAWWPQLGTASTRSVLPPNCNCQKMAKSFSFMNIPRLFKPQQSEKSVIVYQFSLKHCSCRKDQFFISRRWKSGVCEGGGGGGGGVLKRVSCKKKFTCKAFKKDNLGVGTECKNAKKIRNLQE